MTARTVTTATLPTSGAMATIMRMTGLARTRRCAEVIRRLPTAEPDTRPETVPMEVRAAWLGEMPMTVAEAGTPDVGDVTVVMMTVMLRLVAVTRTCTLASTSISLAPRAPLDTDS